MKVLFRNMFPENIIQATFQQVQTNYIPVKPRLQRIPTNIINGTSMIMVNATTAKPLMKPILEYTNEMNVLGNRKVNHRSLQKTVCRFNCILHWFWYCLKYFG